MLYAVQYNCQSQTFRALSDVCALMDAAVWSGGMPAGCSADPVAANERHNALLLNQLMPISMQIPRLYVVTERPCVYRNAAKNPLTRLLPPRDRKTLLYRQRYRFLTVSKRISLCLASIIVMHLHYRR